MSNAGFVKKKVVTTHMVQSPGLPGALPCETDRGGRLPRSGVVLQLNVRTLVYFY